MCFVSQGVFGDGKFTDLEDLIKAVTSIIFISSVGHSAANFAQYDEYAFPPNYPAFLRGKPPTSKVMMPLIRLDYNQGFRFMSEAEHNVLSLAAIMMSGTLTWG